MEELIIKNGTITLENNFQYNALAIPSLMIALVSFNLLSFILCKYTVYKPLRTARNLFLLNIIVSDLFKTIGTFMIFLASVQGTLGYDKFVCKIYGFLSVCLRNVTWLSMAVLVYLRLQQMVYNPPEEIGRLYVALISIIVWSWSIIVALLGIAFEAYVDTDDNSCVVVWFNSKSQSAESFAILSTAVLYYGDTRNDDSEMNLPIVVLVLTVTNFPFMTEQLAYMLMKKTLFNSKFIILCALVISQLSQLLHPILLWFTNYEVNPLLVIGMALTTEGIPQPAEDPAPLVEREPPTGCLEIVYRWGSVNPGRINNAPAVEEFNMEELQPQQHPDIIHVQPAPTASSGTVMSEDAAGTP